MSDVVRARRLRAAPVVVGLAVVLAVVYGLTAPHTSDLAAQTARSELFRRSGFVAYWAGWYAGLPTAGYSLVTPVLLGALGGPWLGAVSIVGTGVVAVPLLRDARRPLAGAVAVVMAATVDVVSGRATFAAGVVVALLAMLAVERRRAVLAGLIAVVATVTSPVAGVLLGVVAAATVLAGPRRRWPAWWALAGVAVALAALAVLARAATSGYEPLTVASLLLSILTASVVVLSPVGRRLRTIAWLTIWLLVACFLVHSPLGANATRIAILGTAPAVVAAARWPRPLLVFAVALAVIFPLAQMSNDLSAAGGVEASPGFVAGLRDRLMAEPSIEDHRVEIVDTRTHWPSTYLLPAVALARGWERQTDEARNPLFYGRAPLTPATYRAFLDREAVAYVAVPVGDSLDYGSTREAALVRGGLPYLHQVWTDAYWRLFAVDSPTSLVAAPGRVVDQTDTGARLALPSAGTYRVRMHWSPYLVIDDGRLSRTPGDQIEVQVPAAGDYLLHSVWRWPM